MSRRMKKSGCLEILLNDCEISICSPFLVLLLFGLEPSSSLPTPTPAPLMGRCIAVSSVDAIVGVVQWCTRCSRNSNSKLPNKVRPSYFSRTSSLVLHPRLFWVAISCETSKRTLVEEPFHHENQTISNGSLAVLAFIAAEYFKFYACSILSGAPNDPAIRHFQCHEIWSICHLIIIACFDCWQNMGQIIMVMVLLACLNHVGFHDIFQLRTLLSGVSTVEFLHPFNLVSFTRYVLIGQHPF